MTEMGVEVLRKFCYVIMEDCFNRGIPICDGAMEIYWSEFLECGTLRHFFMKKWDIKNWIMSILTHFSTCIKRLLLTGVNTW